MLWQFQRWYTDAIHWMIHWSLGNLVPFKSRQWLIYISQWSTITWGHRTRVAAVTLGNMAETRSPLRHIYCKFSPWLFVIAAQLLWVDCQCNGNHWRGSPNCSDSVSRRNSGLKFRVVTRVSAMSVFPGTRVLVSPDEGTAVYRWA